MNRIAEWFKRYFCQHMWRTTTVKIHHGPAVETVTTCDKCGQHVDAYVSFSMNQQYEWFRMAQQLPPGKTEVVYSD